MHTKRKEYLGCRKKKKKRKETSSHIEKYKKITTREALQLLEFICIEKN